MAGFNPNNAAFSQIVINDTSYYLVPKAEMEQLIEAAVNYQASKIEAPTITDMKEEIEMSDASSVTSASESREIFSPAMSDDTMITVPAIEEVLKPLDDENINDDVLENDAGISKENTAEEMASNIKEPVSVAMDTGDQSEKEDAVKILPEKETEETGQPGSVDVPEVFQEEETTVPSEVQDKVVPEQQIEESPIQPVVLEETLVPAVSETSEIETMAVQVDDTPESQKKNIEDGEPLTIVKATVVAESIIPVEQSAQNDLESNEPKMVNEEVNFIAGTPVEATPANSLTDEAIVANNSSAEKAAMEGANAQSAPPLEKQAAGENNTEAGSETSSVETLPSTEAGAAGQDEQSQAMNEESIGEQAQEPATIEDNSVETAQVVMIDATDAAEAGIAKETRSEELVGTSEAAVTEAPAVSEGDAAKEAPEAKVENKELESPDSEPLQKNESVAEETAVDIQEVASADAVEPVNQAKLANLENFSEAEPTQEPVPEIIPVTESEKMLEETNSTSESVSLTLETVEKGEETPVVEDPVEAPLEISAVEEQVVEVKPGPSINEPVTVKDSKGASDILDTSEITKSVSEVSEEKKELLAGKVDCEVQQIEESTAQEDIAAATEPITEAAEKEAELDPIDSSASARADLSKELEKTENDIERSSNEENVVTEKQTEDTNLDTATSTVNVETQDVSSAEFKLTRDVEKEAKTQEEISQETSAEPQQFEESAKATEVLQAITIEPTAVPVDIPAEDILSEEAGREATQQRIAEPEVTEAVFFQDNSSNADKSPAPFEEESQVPEMQSTNEGVALTAVLSTETDVTIEPESEVSPEETPTSAEAPEQNLDQAAAVESNLPNEIFEEETKDIVESAPEDKNDKNDRNDVETQQSIDAPEGTTFDSEKILEEVAHQVLVQAAEGVVEDVEMSEQPALPDETKHPMREEIQVSEEPDVEMPSEIVSITAQPIIQSSEEAITEPKGEADTAQGPTEIQAERSLENDSSNKDVTSEELMPAETSTLEITPTKPVDEATTVEEKTANAQAVSVEEAVVPVEEVAPEEEIAPIENSTAVQEAAPSVDTIPVEESATTAEDAPLIVEAGAVEEIAPIEEPVPVTEPETVQELEKVEQSAKSAESLTAIDDAIQEVASLEEPSPTEEIIQDEECVPVVEDLISVQESMSAEEATRVTETASFEEPAKVEEIVPSVENDTSIKELAPAPENASLEEPTEKKSISIEEPASVERLATVEKSSSVKELATIEGSTKVEEPIPLEESPPVQEFTTVENAKSVDEDVPVTELESAEEAIPTAKSAPVREPASVEDLAIQPVEETVPQKTAAAAVPIEEAAPVEDPAATETQDTLNQPTEPKEPEIHSEIIPEVSKSPVDPQTKKEKVTVEEAVPAQPLFTKGERIAEESILHEEEAITEDPIPEDAPSTESKPPVSEEQASVENLPPVEARVDEKEAAPAEQEATAEQNSQQWQLEAPRSKDNESTQLLTENEPVKKDSPPKEAAEIKQSISKAVLESEQTDDKEPEPEALTKESSEIKANLEERRSTPESPKDVTTKQDSELEALEKHVSPEEQETASPLIAAKNGPASECTPIQVEVADQAPGCSTEDVNMETKKLSTATENAPSLNKPDEREEIEGEIDAVKAPTKAVESADATPTVEDEPTNKAVVTPAVEATPSSTHAEAPTDNSIAEAFQNPKVEQPKPEELIVNAEHAHDRPETPSIYVSSSDDGRNSSQEEELSNLSSSPRPKSSRSVRVSRPQIISRVSLQSFQEPEKKETSPSASSYNSNYADRKYSSLPRNTGSRHSRPESVRLDQPLFDGSILERKRGYYPLTETTSTRSTSKQPSYMRPTQTSQSRSTEDNTPVFNSWLKYQKAEKEKPARPVNTHEHKAARSHGTSSRNSQNEDYMGSEPTSDTEEPLGRTTSRNSIMQSLSDDLDFRVKKHSTNEGWSGKLKRKVSDRISRGRHMFEQHSDHEEDRGIQDFLGASQEQRKADWESLTDEEVQELVQSMPDRIQAALRAANQRPRDY